MTIYGQNQGYFKREKNDCIGTGARTKLHKIKLVVFSLQCMWCYDTFFVTKYVIMTSQWNINYSSVSQKLNLRSCGMKSPNSPVAQCKILARSIQSGQKHQTLHGCSLGHVSQYQDRCPQLPLQDLQQLLAEVLQQPSMMGALC